MDAEFLELGTANAEGNNLNQKYAKRRQESERQGIRLHCIRRSEFFVI
jgi:hypothetical protein